MLVSRDIIKNFIVIDNDNIGVYKLNCIHKSKNKYYVAAIDGTKIDKLEGLLSRKKLIPIEELMDYIFNFEYINVPSGSRFEMSFLEDECLNVVCHVSAVCPTKQCIVDDVFSDKLLMDFKEFRNKEPKIFLDSIYFDNLIT